MWNTERDGSKHGQHFAHLSSRCFSSINSVSRSPSRCFSRCPSSCFRSASTRPRFSASCAYEKKTLLSWHFKISTRVLHVNTNHNQEWRKNLHNKKIQDFNWQLYDRTVSFQYIKKKSGWETPRPWFISKVIKPHGVKSWFKVPRSTSQVSGVVRIKFVRKTMDTFHMILPPRTESNQNPQHTLTHWEMTKIHVWACSTQVLQQRHKTPAFRTR